MAITLASNALIDVDEYCQYRGVDISESVDKDAITLHINAASTAIKHHCGRSICPATTDTEEIINGTHTKEYYVKNLRITGITSISYWTGTDWDELSTSSYPYTYDSGNDRVYFTQGYTFWGGKDQFKIVYSHGYDRDDVPSAIKMACVILVQRSMLKAQKTEGISAESFGDVTNTFDREAMPERVRQLLSPYVRYTFG